MTIIKSLIGQNDDLILAIPEVNCHQRQQELTSQLWRRRHPFYTLSIVNRPVQERLKTSQFVRSRFSFDRTFTRPTRYNSSPLHHVCPPNHIPSIHGSSTGFQVFCPWICICIQCISCASGARGKDQDLPHLSLEPR
jgi:hypothetical protein